MTKSGYAVTLLALTLLIAATLAFGTPAERKEQSHSTLIDCRYENPELKTYADRIPACAPDLDMS